MKSMIYFLVVLMLSSVAFSNESQMEKSSMENKGDVVGESFNFNGKSTVTAVAYGKASNGGYAIKDDSHYVKPQMVTRLPERMDAPKPGPVEIVEEIPSVSNYYNGDAKLNKIQINCKLYANPTDCLHHSSCGWCGASNSCIVGNNMGPLEPCVKSSFIFSAPYPNFNPQARVINENIGGLSLTVISK